MATFDRPDGDPAPPHRPKLSPSATGARAEAAVIIDLLERGFEVFGQFSTGQAIDLVAYCPNDGQTFTVEVRSGQASSMPGRIIFPRKPQCHADAYAVVDHRDLCVFYVSCKGHEERVPSMLLDPRCV